jgi:hypothetical protein
VTAGLSDVHLATGTWGLVNTRFLSRKLNLEAILLISFCTV